MLSTVIGYLVLNKKMSVRIWLRLLINYMDRVTLFRVFNNFLKEIMCRELFWVEVAKSAAQSHTPFRFRKEHIKYHCASRDMVLVAFTWNRTSNGSEFWGLVDVAWQKHLKTLPHEQ